MVYLISKKIRNAFIDFLKSTIFQISITWSFLSLLFYFHVKEPFTEKIINQKYVTSSFEHPADWGNMLYRFASLYDIGKELGRMPYVNGNVPDQLRGLTEMSEYMPALHEIVHIKVPYQSLVTVVDFSDHCCIYESPEKLKQYSNSKYLKLTANYLQSYKFFHKYQTDIAKLFKCSDALKTQSDFLAQKFWKNNDSKNLHKMCVHVRRGDFVPNWPLETRTDFTLPAIKHIYEQLKTENSNKNISLLILGNDEAFINDFIPLLNLDFQSVDTLFSFNTTRSFDMCFGIQHCDSFLLSASSSTFGWWIGYLMKSQGPVYYNAVITKIGSHAKDHFDYDLFPPHWTKLLLQNDTVKIETKWTQERNKIMEEMQKNLNATI